MKHTLVRLTGLVPWPEFDEAFGKHYKPVGRPAKPTRLMVGLHYLKHMYDLSDEEAVERWVENPYWQYLCGFEFFQHRLPIDPSTMTRWRNRIGAAGMETVLAATVGMAVEVGAVIASSWSASPLTRQCSRRISPIPPTAVCISRLCKSWCARPSATELSYAALTRG